MNFVDSPQYKKFCEQSSSSVVIDCGHTKLAMQGNKQHFGINLEDPSPSEINTLRQAIPIAYDLLDKGKKVSLNFCFSDVGHTIDPEKRIHLKKHLSAEKDLYNVLPKSYQKLLDTIKGKISLRFNLQSVNSNLASGILKKLKKKIRSKSIEHIINEYGCLFLLKDNFTFGFISSHLYNYCLKDNDVDLSNILLNPHISLFNKDLIKFPLVGLKKSEFIGLYDKFDGILCPATYMGNLFDISKSNDVIAIYSRSDDSNIGEKLLAGALSYQHISSEKNQFLSIVMQESAESNENYLLEKNTDSPTDAFLGYSLKFLAKDTGYEVYE